jgi:putative ABC transport system permease protein
MAKKISPPKQAERLLERLLRKELAEEVLGDLDEKFYLVANKKSPFRAKINYWYQAANYLRPFALRKKRRSYNSNKFDMHSHYLKIGFRNLLRNKSYTVINTGGLAIGMAVALLTCLWVIDELSYEKFNENYERVAVVMQSQTANGEVFTGQSIPLPLEKVLKDEYGDNFERIALSSWSGSHIVSAGDLKLKKHGSYMDKDATEILGLKMLKGSRNGLASPNSIMLSESAARSFFGDADPMNKTLTLDNQAELLVTGVYQDIPHNSLFHNQDFIAPWSLYVATQRWVQNAVNAQQWDNNSFQLLVQLAPSVSLDEVNERIKRSKFDKVPDSQKIFDAVIFLHPMRDWHLWSNWENGVQTGGLIQYVWLFAIIGLFVLLLACINFVNLATARSGRRSKEVAVRKSMGSAKEQLVQQFLYESFIVVFLAFAITLLVVVFVLPFFNDLTGKQIVVPINSIEFWLSCLAFLLFTGVLAGSYPAFYLSSLQAVKILKGSFRFGKGSAGFRKALVVTQFTISVTLIIGVTVVESQIQHSRNRPIGYN